MEQSYFSEDPRLFKVCDLKRPFLTVDLGCIPHMSECRISALESTYLEMARTNSLTLSTKILPCS